MAQSDTIENVMTETTQSERNYQAIRYVYLGLVLAAFLPFLLSGERQQLAPSVVALTISLGVVHFGLVAYLHDHLIRNDLDHYLPLYFLVQLPLVGLILWLSQDIGGTFWLLFLPVVGQSVNLSRWGMVLLCLTVVLLFGGISLAAGSTWEQARQAVFSFSAAVLFTIIFAFVVTREWETRVKADQLAQELKAANRQLRHYAVQAEELATVQERNRIAREIHDSLGHYLTTINMQLNAAQAVLDQKPDQAQAALGKAQQLTQEGLQAVRQSVAALRESPMGKRPLLPSIDELITETRRAGLIVEQHILGEPRPLDARVELSLYRAVQEGLTNTRKYGRASRVDITLDYSQPHQVQLTIRDNGLGTDKEALLAEGGFGLLGLRERVQLLGGQLSIDTAPQAGFALTILIPTPVPGTG